MRTEKLLFGKKQALLADLDGVKESITRQMNGLEKTTLQKIAELAGEQSETQRNWIRIVFLEAKQNLFAALNRYSESLQAYSGIPEAGAVAAISSCWEQVQACLNSFVPSLSHKIRLCLKQWEKAGNLTLGELLPLYAGGSGCIWEAALSFYKKGAVYMREAEAMLSREKAGECYDRFEKAAQAAVSQIHDKLCTYYQKANASLDETTRESLKKAYLHAETILYGANAALCEVVFDNILLSGTKQLRNNAIQEAELECAWLDWEKQIGEAVSCLKEVFPALREENDRLEEEIAQHLEELYQSLQAYEADMGEDISSEKSDSFEEKLGSAVKQMGDKLSQVGKAIEDYSKDENVREKADGIRNFVNQFAGKAGDAVITGIAMAADGVEKLGKKAEEIFGGKAAPTAENNDPQPENAQPEEAAAESEAAAEAVPGADILDTVMETAAEVRENVQQFAEEAQKTAAEALSDGLKAASSLSEKLADEIEKAINNKKD